MHPGRDIMAQSRRLAVLIDGDNISPRFADALFDKIKSLGTAKVCRVYCDGSHKKSWASILSKHRMHRRRAGTPKSGKNSSDIALVIDAMDLLHNQRFDGFCIASSDSDFARLALRIRKQKSLVFGFGHRDKTPKGYQHACGNFYFVEDLKSPPNPPRV